LVINELKLQIKNLNAPIEQKCRLKEQSPKLKFQNLISKCLAIKQSPRSAAAAAAATASCFTAANCFTTLLV